MELRLLSSATLLLLALLQWPSVAAWDGPSAELLAALVDTSQLDSGMPQQVHIAVTKKSTEMSATWVTFDDVPQFIEYRKVFTSKLKTIPAETTNFTNFGWVRYVHRATMIDLTPGESYAYQVGRPGFISKEFVFRQLSLEPPYNILIFGDLGVYNGESIPSLLRDAAQKSYDLIVNVGDMAYDLFDNNGQVGDQYFATLEPLFATVPYMVVAGNHEIEERLQANFSTYINSFTMPDEGFGDNQFYSFDVGPIHFIGLCSEFYGLNRLHDGFVPVHNQYDWLVKDLQEANKNRASQPWIMSYFHRPFYCSNEDSRGCTKLENHLVRDGSPQLPGLEPILVEQGVDISFWGHEHSYERFFPRSPKYKDMEDPYHNPPGPIYIVSGTAGCHSHHNAFGDPVEYSAARIPDYGYSKMFVANATHIRFYQYSVEQDIVVDSLWIVKEKQTPFQMTKKESEAVDCHPKDMHCHSQKENEHTISSADL